MSLVSIIVPVYNKEKYLQKCLESIVNQTLKDIEIICVNDGSTDGSLQILQEFAANDNRIRIVQKENGGLVSARKLGIQVAIGKYVGYVDSDDYIEPDMYEKLYKTAKEQQVDMVTCGYFLEGNYTTIHLDTVEPGLYKSDKMEELRNNAIYRLKRKETGLRGSLCCKLYKREMLEKVQVDVPETISIAEDKVCLIHCLLQCNSVYVMHEAFYHWCIYKESMSHKANLDYLNCVNEVYKYLVSLYKHENFTDKMRTQVELYITELLVLGINNRLGFKNNNLLRIDPYWLEQIPLGAKLAVYGGGDLGEQYLRQMKSRKDIVCASYLGFELPTIEQLQKIDYDAILIAIKNPGKAAEIRQAFEKLGVDKEKILWFEQPEVYWKYAEAEGLLDE